MYRCEGKGRQIYTNVTKLCTRVVSQLGFDSTYSYFGRKRLFQQSTDSLQSLLAPRPTFLFPPPLSFSFPRDLDARVAVMVARGIVRLLDA